MKKNYLIFSIVYFLFFEFCIAFSQNNELLRQFSKGTVFTQDKNKVLFENINFYDDFVILFSPLKGGLDTIAKSNVLKVNAKTGSYAWESALLGGCVGALIILAPEKSRMDNYPLYRAPDDIWVPALLITIAGAGVGLIVGLLIPKYKDVFVNGRFIAHFTESLPGYNLPQIRKQIILCFNFSISDLK